MSIFMPGPPASLVEQPPSGGWIGGAMRAFYAAFSFRPPGRNASLNAVGRDRPDYSPAAAGRRTDRTRGRGRCTGLCPGAAVEKVVAPRVDGKTRAMGHEWGSPRMLAACGTRIANSKHLPRDLASRVHGLLHSGFVDCRIQARIIFIVRTELSVGVKKTGKGRRKLGRKKRRMRSRIRHRKG